MAQQEELVALQEDNEQLRTQFTTLATELASLRERIGRSSRNSSKPPSSDGPGFKPPERRKGSGRKRGGQPGHPGSGPELLPIERVDKLLDHHPDACRRCGTLPADVEASRYGPRLSALVGLLGSAFPLSVSKTQALLNQLLGVEISCGTIATIRQRLSAALAQPMAEALQAARQQPVAYVVDEVLRAAVETGAPMGNADGGNPDGKRGWQWV